MNPMTDKEIARKTGLSVKQVRRARLNAEAKLLDPKVLEAYLMKWAREMLKKERAK